MRPSIDVGAIWQIPWHEPWPWGGGLPTTDELEREQRRFYKHVHRLRAVAALRLREASDVQRDYTDDVEPGTLYQWRKRERDRWSAHRRQSWPSQIVDYLHATPEAVGVSEDELRRVAGEVVSEILAKPQP